MVGRGQPLHQALDRVDVLLRLVGGGRLRPRRVVLGQEHAVWQGPEQVLEQGGGHEDRDLGPVDLLPLVQALAQVPHHPHIGTASEDADGLRPLLLELDQHRGHRWWELRSAVATT